MKFQLIGLRVLHRVIQEDGIGSSSPTIEEVYEVLLLHREEAAMKRKQRYVLHLATEFGMCGSGYCSANWSSESLEKVQNFGPMTHRMNSPWWASSSAPERSTRPLRRLVGRDPAPGQKDQPSPLLSDDALAIQPVQIEMKVREVEAGNYRPAYLTIPKTYENEFFGWTGDGGDEHYPSGSASVHIEKFESTGRGRDKPLVHVFLGDSNLGKTSLGDQLSSVYETDQGEDFKEEMVYAQTIVLGNKHPEQTLHGIRKFFKEKGLDVDIVPVRFGEPIRFEEDK